MSSEHRFDEPPEHDQNAVPARWKRRKRPPAPPIPTEQQMWPERFITVRKRWWHW